MSVQHISPEELLALDKFSVDEQEAHILVDKIRCKDCQSKPCLVVCSAVC